MIDNEDWDYLQDKYKKLIDYIAMRIYSDHAHDKEDLVSILNLSIFSAVKGYQKKTGEKIKEFIRTPMFGKYLKVVLWNKRNTLAAEFANAYQYTKESIDVCEFKDSLADDREELNFDSFNDDEVSFIELIMDPSREYNGGYGPDFKKIATKLNCPIKKVRMLYYSVLGKMKNAF